MVLYPSFALLLLNFYFSFFLSICCLPSSLSPRGAWITHLQSCFFSLTNIVYVSLNRDSPPTDVLELSRVLITSNVLRGVKEPGVISTLNSSIRLVCFSHPKANEFITTSNSKGPLKVTKLTR